MVRIEPTESLIYSGGQEVLTPDGVDPDGYGLNFVKISVPGYYSYIEFNIDARLDGPVSFSSNLGDLIIGSPFSLDANGDPISTDVPAPGTLAILGAGLFGLAFFRRRRATA